MYLDVEKIGSRMANNSHVQFKGYLRWQAREKLQQLFNIPPHFLPPLRHRLLLLLFPLQIPSFSYFSFFVPEETFALDAKIASPRIIDYKLLVSLP